jgi:hypothetical protein
MKPVFKNLLLIASLNILTVFTGYLCISKSFIDLALSDIIYLSATFTVITSISIVIFFRGSERHPESQTMHTLVAVTLKFLLELILALVWFIVAKKSSFHSVFIFFVLYLTFTLVLVVIILKTLKNKSL